MIGEFPAQRASNVENVSIWWRHIAASAGELDIWALFYRVCLIAESGLALIQQFGLYDE